MANISYRIYPQDAKEMVRIITESVHEYVESYIGQDPEPLSVIVPVLVPCNHINLKVVVTKAGVSFEPG